jgi:hypothetical protein
LGVASSQKISQGIGLVHLPRRLKHPDRGFQMGALFDDDRL